MASRFQRPLPPKSPLNLGALVAGIVGGIQSGKQLEQGQELIDLQKAQQAAEAADAAAELQATAAGVDTLGRIYGRGSQDPLGFIEDPLGSALRFSSDTGSESNLFSKLSRSTPAPMSDEFRGRLFNAILGDASKGLGQNIANLNVAAPRSIQLGNIMATPEFQEIFKQATLGETAGRGLSNLGNNTLLNAATGRFFSGPIALEGVPPGIDAEGNLIPGTPSRLIPSASGRLKIPEADLVDPVPSSPSPSPAAPRDLELNLGALGPLLKEVQSFGQLQPPAKPTMDEGGLTLDLTPVRPSSIPLEEKKPFVPPTASNIAREDLQRLLEFIFRGGFTDLLTRPTRSLLGQ